MPASVFPELAIISNRPPVGQPSGGAMVVINEGNPSKWVGPIDVPDTRSGITRKDIEQGRKPYDEMSDSEREPLTPFVVIDRAETKQGPLSVYLSPQKRSLQEVHYGIWSNTVAWPVLHEMNPADYQGQPASDDVSQELARKSLSRQRYHLGMTVDQLEKAYSDFRHMNDNLNGYLAQLQATGTFPAGTIGETHDYQMPGVVIPGISGNLFFSHIPFPRLEALKKYDVDAGERFHDREHVPLVKTHAWKNYIESMVLPYEQLAFQRPVDMRNFLESLAYYDPKFRANNPRLFGADGAPAPTPMGEAGARDVVYTSTDRETGKPLTHRLVIMSQVVGTSLEKNLKEARDNEHLLDKTQFRLVSEPKDEYKNGEMDAAQAAACGIGLPAGPEASINLRELLSNRRDVNGKPLDLLEAEGHNLFVSFHRNDYTKSTMEKLEAIEQYLSGVERQHPDRIGKDHFVIFAQPTRLTVGGYRQYAEQVVAKTSQLRERFGDGVLLVPAGVEHTDLMGLVRNKNIAAIVSTGKKDGCDLTQDEVNHANADRRSQATGLGVPLANITTDGTGAAEKYTGTAEEPIGFIVPSANARAMKKSLVEAFDEIGALRESAAGRRQLAVRNGRAMDAAIHYSGKHFHDVLLETFCARALPLKQATAGQRPEIRDLREHALDGRIDASRAASRSA